MALLLKRHFSNSLAYYSLKKNYKENPSAVINPSQVTIFSAPCHLDCTFYPYACHKNDTNLYLKCPRKLHVLSGASLGGRATANVLLNDTDHLLFFFLSFSIPAASCHMFPTWCTVQEQWGRVTTDSSFQNSKDKPTLPFSQLETWGILSHCAQ